MPPCRRSGTASRRAGVRPAVPEADQVRQPRSAPTGCNAVRDHVRRSARRLAVRGGVRLRRARRRAPIPRRPERQLATLARAAHDAFSTYRAGFEVRTYRRCRAGADVPPRSRRARTTPDYDGLVRSTDLSYRDSRRPGLSSRRITQSGYVRHAGWHATEALAASAGVRLLARPGSTHGSTTSKPAERREPARAGSTATPTSGSISTARV